MVDLTDTRLSIAVGGAEGQERSLAARP
jgi:hypothetical protein